MAVTTPTPTQPRPVSAAAAPSGVPAGAVARRGTFGVVLWHTAALLRRCRWALVGAPRRLGPLVIRLDTGALVVIMASAASGSASRAAGPLEAFDRGGATRRDTSCNAAVAECASRGAARCATRGARTFPLLAPGRLVIGCRVLAAALGPGAPLAMEGTSRRPACSGCRVLSCDREHGAESGAGAAATPGTSPGRGRPGPVHGRSGAARTSSPAGTAGGGARSSREHVCFPARSGRSGAAPGPRLESVTRGVPVMRRHGSPRCASSRNLAYRADRGGARGAGRPDDVQGRSVRRPEVCCPSSPWPRRSRSRCAPGQHRPGRDPGRGGNSRDRADGLTKGGPRPGSPGRSPALPGTTRGGWRLNILRGTTTPRTPRFGSSLRLC